MGSPSTGATSMALRSSTSNNPRASRRLLRISSSHLSTRNVYRKLPASGRRIDRGVDCRGRGPGFVRRAAARSQAPRRLPASCAVGACRRDGSFQLASKVDIVSVRLRTPRAAACARGAFAGLGFVSTQSSREPGHEQRRPHGMKRSGERALWAYTYSDRAVGASEESSIRYTFPDRVQRGGAFQKR
jgi:hypothetical protein